MFLFPYPSPDLGKTCLDCACACHPCRLEFYLNHILQRGGACHTHAVWNLQLFNKYGLSCALYPVYAVYLLYCVSCMLFILYMLFIFYIVYPTCCLSFICCLSSILCILHAVYPLYAVFLLGFLGFLINTI